MLQIRQAKPDEYESILRFLGEGYGASRDAFPRRNPEWWGEHTDFSRIWLMDRGGRIESLVRIFPLELVLGETTVSVGGIGAVSTHPSARGQGHMHHLMYRAIEEMKKEFCLSILWGDRHRYQVFGYENGGSVLKMRITARGLTRLGAKPLDPHVYHGETETLRQIQECHQRESFRRLRSEHEDALIYGKSELVVWTAGAGEHFGYLALARKRGEWSVAEFGGHPLTVLGLCAYRFSSTGSDSLSFSFPTRDVAPAEYWLAASDWTIQAAASIKILHLPTAIDLFRPWLSHNPDAADPGLLHLQETEAVERLFGVARQGAAPFFCWPLDHV